MNKYGIYAIKDKKAGYAFPQVDINDDSAIRGFKFACTQRGNLMSAYAEDYCLYKLGLYDPETGEIILQDKQIISEGSSFVSEVQGGE